MGEQKETLLSWKNILWIVLGIGAIVVNIILWFWGQQMPLVFKILITVAVSGLLYLSLYFLLRSSLAIHNDKKREQKTAEQIEQKVNKLREEIHMIVNEEIPEQVKVKELKNLIRISIRLFYSSESFSFPKVYEDIGKNLKPITDRIREIQSDVLALEKEYKDWNNSEKLKDKLVKQIKKIEKVSQNLANKKRDWNNGYNFQTLYQLTIVYDNLIAGLISIHKRELESSDFCPLRLILLKENIDLGELISLLLL